MGPPEHFVEFPTPADPASQPVGVFPALAPPKARPPRRPRRRPRRPPRRRRIVVTVPMWVLLGLAVLAAIAGLLFLPAISPWPAPPPSDEPEPGVGVIGPGHPDTGVGPVSPGTTPGATSGGRPGTRPSATSTPEPTPSATGGGVPPPAADLYISYFSATPLAVVAGYRVTVGIANRGAGSGDWENIGVRVSGGVPLGMEVEVPQTGVRPFSGSGRACLTPTTSDTANLAAGETLTIVLRINTLLAQTPGPAQTPDQDGCAEES